MFKTLRTALCVLGALLPAALPSVATAGSYPVKPIQLIVPYGPGGDSDLTARVWAEFAKQRLGQPVVVVNKAGGGGLAGEPWPRPRPGRTATRSIWSRPDRC